MCIFLSGNGLTSMFLSTLTPKDIIESVEDSDMDEEDKIRFYIRAYNLAAAHLPFRELIDEEMAVEGFKLYLKSK